MNDADTGAGRSAGLQRSPVGASAGFAANAEKYLTSEIHSRGESLEWILRMALPRSEWKAIDIGTGAGHVACMLAPLVAEVAACDPTSEMLEVAKKNASQRGIANIRFHLHPAEQTGFESESFELATCRLAFHHVIDREKALGEIRRVLKRGSLFLLTDNYTLDDPELARRHNDFERLRDPSHQRLLSVAEGEAELAGAGFHVTEFVELCKRTRLVDWAQRQGCSAEVVAELEKTLAESTGMLEAFLDPKLENGDWTFAIREVVYRAERID